MGTWNREDLPEVVEAYEGIGRFFDQMLDRGEYENDVEREVYRLEAAAAWERVGRMGALLRWQERAEAERAEREA